MIRLPIACTPFCTDLWSGRDLRPEIAAAGLGLNIGPELVEDGDFEISVPWLPGTGWVIEDSAALRAPGALVASALTQPIALIPGASYVVTFTLSPYPVGAVFIPSFTVQFTGGTPRTGVARSAPGTYREVLQANVGNNTLSIDATTTAAAAVDSVSVRRLG